VDWHAQIIKIMKERDKTASGVLTLLYDNEIDGLRASRKATKQVYQGYF